MTKAITVSDDKARAEELLRNIFGAAYANSSSNVAEVARYFTKCRLAALDEAAEVADGWWQSDFNESANAMASNIRDDILALKETPDAK